MDANGGYTRKQAVRIGRALPSQGDPAWAWSSSGPTPTATQGALMQVPKVVV